MTYVFYMLYLYSKPHSSKDQPTRIVYNIGQNKNNEKGRSKKITMNREKFMGLFSQDLNKTSISYIFLGIVQIYKGLNK